MDAKTQIVLTGFNHKTAAVEVRERCCFDDEEAVYALPALKETAGLDEVVLLSTCNRTEVYGVVSTDPEPVQERLGMWLAASAGMEARELDGHLYRHVGEGAIEHLFRVAAGLDSLVLGEPQILGQVRDAFEAAKTAKTVDQRLTRLFRSAVEAGKEVRTSTPLGTMPVSVASVAVQLVERVFGDLADRTVVVVGAGEICTAAARHLSERSPARLVVLNRTAERAEILAAQCCGESAPLARLDDELCLADVVITSTGAPEPLVTKAMLAAAMKRRRGERLLIVDVAVPRDVEPSAASVNNVYIYDVDDLQNLAAENLKQRMAEIPRAERIIDATRARYDAWAESLAVVPTIVALRSRLESIREAGVRQYVNKLPDLDDRGRRCIEQMTQTIVNRILHEPQIRLRQSRGPTSAPAMAESLRYLFDLDGSAEERRS